MMNFIALYRGPTVSEARLVAVSSEPEIVGRFVRELTGEAENAEDWGVRSASRYTAHMVAMSSRRKGTAIRVSRTYMNEPTACARALKLLLKGCVGEGAYSNEKAPALARVGGAEECT